MLIRWKVGGLLLGCVLAVAGCHHEKRLNSEPPRSGKTSAYLLMGFGDREWSGGLDQLAAKLNREGLNARVEPYRNWKPMVREILRERPEQLVLIGHSHGGVDAIRAANLLQREGFSVRLLVLLDVGRPDPIPPNVDYAVHYYLVPPSPTFRNGPRDKLEPGNTHTQLTNVAVGRDGEVPETRDLDHLTITNSAAIHRMITGNLASAGVHGGSRVGYASDVQKGVE